MRIVSWNFRNGLELKKSEKFLEILKENGKFPDILTVQECKKEECEKINFIYKDWFGDSKDSYLGVGIFSNKYKFERALEHNINFRYIIPYHVTDLDNDKRFVLFLIWTKNVCCDYPYIGQVYSAVNYPGYKKLLNDHVILIGDFNANKIWDNDNNKINNPTFSEVVNILKEKGIHSLYHKILSNEYGAEKHKTHYNSSQKKYYHIDYCFSSDDMNPNSIFLASEQDWDDGKNTKSWKSLSDHSPLIVEFDF